MDPYHDITPKNYIKSILIEEVGDIVRRHAYIGFSVVCLGIEFLGSCLDKKSSWTDNGKSQIHFESAVDTLFPKQYKQIKTELYKELRCGLVHSHLSGRFKLTEAKNAYKGELSYEKHLKDNKNILVMDYFYFDYMQACLKVLSMDFESGDKMNKGIIRVGPLF